MDDISLIDAKDHLEELMARAARGEDVRITDPKLGTVKLLRVPREPDLTAPRVTDTMEPFVPLQGKRTLGHLRGVIQVPSRLMEPMDEQELRDWYGDNA
jgi:antitoxin (DNA-binding transcriptional repressor) of toxin-antitoxin stability system